jgi:proteic killer suppression protein
LFFLIKNFRHQGLLELAVKGKSANVPPQLAKRCRLRLAALLVATDLSQLNVKGFNLHQLHTKPVRHSIHVNGPWAITFEWDAPYASKVDLEQYH